MTDFYTPNFRVRIPPFNERSWHDDYKDGFVTFDAFLAKYIASGNIRGVWQPDILYEIDEVLVDGDLGSIWTCLITHTSGLTTFYDDRVAHPTYWTPYTVTSRYVGAWQPDTQYIIGDFSSHEAQYIIANTTHVSGSAYDANEAATWDVLIDLTSISSVVPASETTAGIAELATQAETLTATDDLRIVTPKKLKQYFDNNVPVVDNITNAQLADMPSKTYKMNPQLSAGPPEDVTPLVAVMNLPIFSGSNNGVVPNVTSGDLAANRLLRADATWIDPPQQASEVVVGIAEVATQAEANAGTDDARMLTALKLRNLNGVVVGPLSIGNGTGSPVLALDGAAGAAGNKLLRWRSASVERWAALTSGAADDWQINRYDDAGAFVAIALSMVRATGLVTVSASARIVSGLQIGTPTGGDKGAGTINAQSGIYDNNVRIGQQATEAVRGEAEIADTTEVNAGSDDARIVTPAKLAARLAAVSAGTIFVSSGSVPTTGSLITVAHGLGATPSQVWADLKCIDVTGDGGWVQNDVVYNVLGLNGSGAQPAFSAYADATNVYARVATNVAHLCNKTTGGDLAITVAKWNLILKARL